MILTNKFSVTFGLCLVITMLGFISTPAQTQPGNSSGSLDAQSQKIKDKVEKIGLGSNITVINKSKNEFYGAVANIGDDSILVDDVDQKVRVEIKYSDIKKVRDGYGTSRGRNGTRIPRRKNLIAFAVIGGLFATLGIILATQME